MDARRSSKRILDAHPTDQCTEVRLDLWLPSPRARLSMPIATKASTMPTHERLGLDFVRTCRIRRNPSIQLDQEPAVIVRQPNPATNLAPQNHQLMSERCILCLKPILRLECEAKMARTQQNSANIVP